MSYPDTSEGTFELSLITDPVEDQLFAYIGSSNTKDCDEAFGRCSREEQMSTRLGRTCFRSIDKACKAMLAAGFVVGAITATCICWAMWAISVH